MTDTQTLFKQVVVNGTRLAYRDTGSGDTIVLIHGNVGDHRTFSALEQMLLTSGHRVINYSRRFCWPNTPINPDEEDPLDMHADDLIALIVKLEVGKAHLVGNSSGGFLALLAARKRPDLVRSIVLEEAPVISLFLPSLPPSVLQILSFLWYHPRAFLPVIKFGAIVIGSVTSAFKNGEDDKALDIFGRGVLGEKHYCRLTPERKEQMKCNIAPLRALLLGKGLPRFLEEDAREVITPTLLLTASETPESQKWIDRRLREVLPNAEQRIIPNASHLMHEDNTLDTVKEILDFIAQY